MNYQIGEQYTQDDGFKAAARLHQSHYRANNLKIDYDDYGNRLKNEDAEKLLNYYEGLNVRSVLRKRFPVYSKKRDADMLRSEHIPFNLFAPLTVDHELTKQIIQRTFGINCNEIQKVEFEWAPKPKENYLDDATAFDVYISYLNEKNMISGIGIEVKYTEKAYTIGLTEKKKVNDENSSYWSVARASGVFLDFANPAFVSDELRQIWRNHLLGLAMVQRNEIKDFTSIIIFPARNLHFLQVIPDYQDLLCDSCRNLVYGCTYESYITAISGNEEMEHWKEYLQKRYIVSH